MDARVSQRCEARGTLSVVIATLGGGALHATISAINAGSIVPDEILVCIPRVLARKVAGLGGVNVRVVATDCKGQVAQRRIGFNEAASEMVMQLDDDIFVDRDCIARLMRSLMAHGPKAAIAPSLVDLSSGRSIYHSTGKTAAAQKVLGLLLNGRTGYRQGTIDKCGRGIGLDADGVRPGVHEVEWLPGGCVLHYRDNLVLENFFPLSGKAYCEDLFHSYHLAAKGIRLLVDTTASCRMENANVLVFDGRAFLREIMGDYRAKKCFLRMSGRPQTRLYVYCIVQLARYVASRIGRAFTFR